MYASFEFCNNIDSDEEFREFDMDDTTTEHEPGANTGDREPVADIIRRLAEDKLRKDCTLRVKVMYMINNCFIKN